ncbi:hypothetical protein R80B4_00059 [Fibrobacteres bacterium R8-0-B4]
MASLVKADSVFDASSMASEIAFLASVGVGCSCGLPPSALAAAVRRSSVVPCASVRISSIRSMMSLRLTSFLCFRVSVTALMVSSLSLFRA